PQEEKASQLARLLFLLARLRLSACKKEQDPLDTLPAAPQTGAGRVGGRQDGQADQPMTSAFRGRTSRATPLSKGAIDRAFTHDTRKRHRGLLLPNPRAVTERVLAASTCGLYPTRTLGHLPERPPDQLGVRPQIGWVTLPGHGKWPPSNPGLQQPGLGTR
ncbi:hypothetical protein ACW9KT_19905, partial [Hymenobacter sp. HD11105]